MSDPVKQLLAAFQRDHAVLGHGLYDMAVALRAGDILTAKRVATELDRDAGPHIAFEERYFYPRMRALIGDEEVDRLYREHHRGQSALLRILAMPDAAWPDAAQMKALLADVELMQHHVAECGELFGAMGRIPMEDQRTLLDDLERLRSDAPGWTELEPASVDP